MSYLTLALRLLSLYEWVKGFLSDRKLVQQGMREQQAADIQAVNMVLKNQQQASANAPSTRRQLEEALKKSQI